MKQYTENQYDDDLTIGTDDYDDSYYTGSVDLFEFSNDDESPISRLKSLILSIDWEITDEVLMQFNEELVDLRDIWAKEKINLIYVQALEKISKYIYQKKADSHPSAIKLLLTLYHNLEKIVSSSDLSEEQKKEILLEDVKRFEQLKTHISNPSGIVSKPPTTDRQLKEEPTAVHSERDLQTLKAIVLGIDWEITDDDLNALRQEVVTLEAKFAESRPRLILLQGIGTLGAYIKLKKSDAHADAFKILHLFYDCLEKIVRTPMTLAEEKAILFPAVEKFNSFKTLLGPTISVEAIHRTEKDPEEDTRSSSSLIIPAFSDLPDEEVIGFQAEEEAKALGFESADNVDDHVESFFMGTSFEETEFPIIDDSEPALDVDQKTALQGVDVEVDDEEDSDEIAAPDNSMFGAVLDDKVDYNPTPALGAVGISTDKDEPVGRLGGEDAGELHFSGGDNETTEMEFGAIDRDVLLQGVDVETEADDDSDEDALPMLGGELAPALADNDEESIYNAELFETSTEAQNVDDEIAGNLGGFFAEKDDSHISGALKIEVDKPEIASDMNDFDEEGVESSPVENYLFDAGSEDVDLDNLILEERFEENDLASLDEDDAFFLEESDAALKEENEIDEFVDTVFEGEEEAIAFVSEPDLDESLDSFFDGDDLEQDPALEIEETLSFADGEQGFLEEESEDAHAESAADFDDNIDSFFGLPDEDFSEEADKLLFDQGDEAVEESRLALENDVTVALVESEEQEVVFELVEELESAAEAVDFADTDQLEEMDAGELPLPDGTGDFSAQIEVSGDEDLAAIVDDSEPSLKIDMSSETFGSLQTCVESLGVELDEKVISGLWREVDHLEKKLVDKPLEKTFLQLFRTISRHIDQNRYDSSSDAYVLLQSVCNALNDLQEYDLHGNQEMLLAETQKVLRWQEELLVQQTAKSEAELTIDDADPFLQQNYGEVCIESTSNGEDFDQSEQGLQVLAQGQERLADIEKKEILTDDLKKEIATLRQSLQDEITALRNELKGDYS